MVETIYKVKKVTRILIQELGRKPTDEEISKRTELPIENIVAIRKYSQIPISLEMPIGDEETSQLGDFIEDKNLEAPESSSMRNILRQELQDSMSVLTEREQMILKLRFGFESGFIFLLNFISNYICCYPFVKMMSRIIHNWREVSSII